ncbi:MAG: flagellin [Bradyrhizobium sp.]|uniref:flagellin N-terminal helical domain-containing protein n=1 Tax=Bradyrhizobium sp. TaxID=376 RepID=UPI0027239D09|nr:flagellin [Bradyrhizobium sp.]MDO8399216.1 flagellin [Bradyrhizobium sp.]
MSGIVLSSSVRQNLLSLQSTADLLATTQNRLATGKKVNTALDNPTNFFTASSLDARAGDISNLLDGIGNGVQVLQAANTGISSLQKLVDSAKSVANQALQSTVGYSSKSTVSVTINGATSDNLLGTGAPIDATVAGSAALTNQLYTYTANTGAGAAVTANHQTAYVNTTATAGSQLYSAAATNATGATLLSALTDVGGAAQAIAAGNTVTINGRTITFAAGNGALAGGGTAYTLGVDTSLTDFAAALDTLQGNTTNPSGVAGGIIQLNTGLTADLNVTASGAGVLTALGLSAAGTRAATRTGGVTSTPGITGATLLSGSAIPGGADALVSGITAGDYLVVNNKTITFHSGGGNTGSIATNDLSIDITTGTVATITAAIDLATGGSSTSAGSINLTTSTAADISFTGSSAGTLAKLGLTGPINRNTAGGPVALTGTTLLSGAASTSSNSLTTAFAAGDTITVNGQNITFLASGASGNNQVNITDNVNQLLGKIDALSGSAPLSAVVGGVVTLHTGTTSDLSISSSNAAALAGLGFAGPVAQARGTGASPLNGLSLAIASTGGGTATNFTFGSGVGQVKSLNDLNSQLASNNLQATLAANGTLTITTSNDAASSTIGAITGTAAAGGQLFNGLTVSAPVADASATATRNNLVNQYNNILNQIDTTSQDASFNGVNLLSGDTLKLTFNETGKSTLSISGVNFNAAGLGLASLAAGDFKDNESVATVVGGLNAASGTLRSQASAFGSNLSIVQIRQDFSKNLINVLQTGSSNLTLADTNEEAANSQALSTRQSIAVSALALANQSQQSVLQLLR